MRQSFEFPTGPPALARTTRQQAFDSRSKLDGPAFKRTSRDTQLFAEPRTIRELDSHRAASGENWRDSAECRGRIELFFAKRAERPEARARREAKALTLCNQCAVAVQCREFAREHHEYGFWAGESEEDRHVLGFTVSAPIGTRARRTDLPPRSGAVG